jgi:hypothetical protein
VLRTSDSDLEDGSSRFFENVAAFLSHNTAQKTVIFKMFAYTDVNLEHFSWDLVFVLMSVHLRNRIGKLFSF